MNLHYFQHVPFEGLGSIERWARAVGHAISATRFHCGDAVPRLDDVDWLVVMGGPMSVHDESVYPWLAEEKRFIGQAIAAGKPVLGICLGAQLIAAVLGARVYRNRQKEIGWFPIQITEDASHSALGLVRPEQLEAFHWHGDTFDLPPGAVHLARSEACEHQAFALGDRVLALQFHLETTPESAAALIEHCGDELVPAPGIQSATAMMADPQRFQGVNETMDRLLDHLAARCVA